MIFKADGRKSPAEQAELTKLKGKQMKCPQCGNTYVVAKATFANEVCESCGASLEELNFAQSKMNGSR
jgi:uncharacterized protein (DUF983 family)